MMLVCLCELANTAQHTDNWAVLVGTSRFWFNYRHAGNTLSIYHGIKKLGIPDSNIILMLADDMPCNARNIRPAQVSADEAGTDIYGTDVEVDYRGEEVTVENFIRVLTGRHRPGTSPAKQLRSHQTSNVLIYLSGHGGDEFLKFQDSEEISSQDFADAVEQMHIQHRYNQLLFITDTCQAATLNNHFYSPNVFAIGSSLKDENSYSHGFTAGLGVTILDRFSYMLCQYLKKLSRDSESSLADMVQHFKRRYDQPNSHLGAMWTAGMVAAKVKVTDFFGSVFQTSVPKQQRKLGA